MALRTGLGNPKSFKERRERKIDNLLQTYSYLSKSQHFTVFCANLEASNKLNFQTFLLVHYINFKNNLRYIQKYSGLNARQFCLTAGLGVNALSLSQSFPTTIPMHTFVKAYSMMQQFIYSIEFCDMFLLDFSQTFPNYKDSFNANRIKFGKEARKVYTYQNK